MLPLPKGTKKSNQRKVTTEIQTKFSLLQVINYL